MFRHPKENMYFKPPTGIGRGKGRRKAGGNSSKGESIRGVSQAQIDKLRGEAGHGAEGTITIESIQETYKRVGITLTRDDADEIREALKMYSDYYFDSMRNALLKSRRGEPLSIGETNYLRNYRLSEEYTRIAPKFTYGAGSTETEIFRGVFRPNDTRPEGQKYFDSMLTLRVGDKFDHGMRATSYTTNLKQAYSFAGRKYGIIVHAPLSHLKNAVSLKGISAHSEEDEVLVSDYGLKVARISDLRNTDDGNYHIYLE